MLHTEMGDLLMSITSIRRAGISALLLVTCSALVFAQRPSSLRGQVTDQLGAVVVGVRITLTTSSGQQQVAQPDNNAAYRFDNVSAGVFSLAADQRGFAPYAKTDLNLAPGPNSYDFQLAVTIAEQRVTVDNPRELSADPNSNKSARVISGKELATLSDDPDELAAQLNALAGPAAGPN